MEIELHEIAIKDVAEGFEDHGNGGVKGYGGKLDIRPAYQREYIYKGKQRDAVINTVTEGFPLNVMYWVVNDDGFEVLDGQQRTIAICEYVKGMHSYKEKYFNSLPEKQQEAFNNYKLMVYFCSGDEQDKMDWFETINIAGEKLFDQELRNAVCHGSWVSDAKLYFSRVNQGADGYKDYLNGILNRQDYLETAIKWAAHIEGNTIREYMSLRRRHKSAEGLWVYFETVMKWVQDVFPTYRKEMKGVEWGQYYNLYKEKFSKKDTKNLEKKIVALLNHEDVKSSGIYDYLLTGEEKHINVRLFTEKDKKAKFKEQGGKCLDCGKACEYKNMEADHIKPWSLDGPTNSNNLQMLCVDCNRQKGAK